MGDGSSERGDGRSSEMGGGRFWVLDTSPYGDATLQLCSVQVLDFGLIISKFPTLPAPPSKQMPTLSVSRLAQTPQGAESK